MLHLSCVLDKESYMAICKSSFVLAREWVGYNGFEYCRVSIMSQNMLFPKSIYLPWSCLNIFIEKKNTMRIKAYGHIQTNNIIHRNGKRIQV